MSKAKNIDEKNYKTISVSDTNKSKLEDIQRDLEQHHKKSLRVDLALGHVLAVYDKIKEPDKYYDILTIKEN